MKSPSPTREISTCEKLQQRLAAIPELPTVSELAQTAAVMLAGKGPDLSTGASLQSEALSHWFACRDVLKAHLQKQIDQIHNDTEEEALKKDLAQLDADGETAEFFAAFQDDHEPIVNFKDGLKQIFGAKGAAGDKESRLRQILIAEYRKIARKSNAPIDDEKARARAGSHLAKLKSRGFTVAERANARHLAARFKSENVRAKNQKIARKRWAKQPNRNRI
jgi:hypothetical protein